MESSYKYRTMITVNLVNIGKRIKEKTGRVLKALVCHCCGQIFYLCSHCYRGHKYCSKLCKTSAQRAAHREAQKRYRETEKGKKAHCESEKRRRLGKAAKGRFKKVGEMLVRCCKSAVEKAKTKIETVLENPDAEACCHFCHCHGRIVQKFNRAYNRKGKQAKKELMV